MCHVSAARYWFSVMGFSMRAQWSSGLIQSSTFGVISGRHVQASETGQLGRHAANRAKQMLLALLAIGLLFLSSTSFAVGDPDVGRERYLANCSGCHGVPPDHRALSTAGDPDFLFLTINYVGRMGFLATRVTFTDIENITAYLATPAIYTNVIGVAPQGNGAGSIVSTPTGLSCGTRCAWNFALNTDVTLRAQPAIGSTFTGWSGACSGLGECRVRADQAKAVFATFTRNGPAVDYTDLWWGGATESDWGVAVSHVARDATLNGVIYAHARDGRPEWYLFEGAEGGVWSENFTVYRVPLFRPRGASFAAYDATQFQRGIAVGEVVFRLRDRDSVEMTYRVGDQNGVRILQRKSLLTSIGARPFATQDSWQPPCRLCRDNRATIPLRVQGSWQGNVAEKGWALVLSQQRASLVGVWYTFDELGEPTWFWLPSGTWTDNRFTTTLMRTRGRAWPNDGTTAVAPTTEVVGSMIVNFTNATTAVKSVQVHSAMPISQQKPVTRTSN
jgi:mono/diheme cytochrome c family protein